jgi:hypothetical protein
MKQSKFPPGWDEQRVRKVIAHYEAQTEDEAVAEDELVPVVKELIAKHHSKNSQPSAVESA